MTSAVSGTGYRETGIAGAAVGHYTRHAPIRVDNVHAPADDPVIIEGFEISSDEADCIEVKNSTDVVIRGNYLHDCTWSRDPAEPYSQDEGFAIRVGYAEFVVIADNVLERNKMGIAVHSSSRVLVRSNTITTTVVKSSLRLERVDNAEVTYNYLADNGVPEHFWAPGHRDIGIYLVRSDAVQVHDNMELGMWLVRARGLSIQHNTIRGGCFTPGSGIGLDFDVDDSEVFANQIVTCLNDGYVGLAMSHDNHIHGNVHFSLEDEPFRIRAQDDATNDQIKADRAGIPFRPSSGNLVEDETHLRLGGELRRVMLEKRELADRERTWQERGWFSATNPQCGRIRRPVVPKSLSSLAVVGWPGIPDDGHGRVARLGLKLEDGGVASTIGPFTGKALLEGPLFP